MKIAIIGAFTKTLKSHIATNNAIKHSTRFLNVNLQAEWVSTEYLQTNFKHVISEYHGFWIAPGGAYKNRNGIMDLLKHTRNNQIPTIGTCGGFQQMSIEFARNKLNLDDAEHAEYAPKASRLVVNPLSCNLKGEPLHIDIIEANSKTYSIYGVKNIWEKYYCNFGLNPKYQDDFNKNGFRIVGSDKHKEARILELDNHPFFIATLFVPQDSSSFENPHKLVTEFIKTTISV